MADYMGSQMSDNGGPDKDLGAMLLPHTSISEASGMLSPSPEDLPSPAYLSRMKSSGMLSSSPEDSMPPAYLGRMKPSDMLSPSSEDPTSLPSPAYLGRMKTNDMLSSSDASRSLTSLNYLGRMKASDILTSSSSDLPSGLPSGYLSRGVSVSSAVDYVSQSPQTGYMSHSALTGLAAAAAHHARYNAPSVSHSLPPGLCSPPSQSPMSTPHMLPSSSGGAAAVETSDTGSGGAPLSISYMRQGDNYVCSLCGKTVASKAAITRHIQLTHEKKKPFECNICQRRFGYKNILLEHQNIHFGIKPYSCNLCDKRFAARSNLFQHRLLHMKPFHCEVCNKRFDRADQLQRHVKLHPSSNVLSCNLCQFQASNVETLNTHLKETHTLQTINTRSRFGQPDDFRGSELPTQVPLSLSGPIPASGPAAALALNLETEAMRKIDTICSQLASKTLPLVKSEPLSPGFSSAAMRGFPPASPSGNLGSPPFSMGAEPSGSMLTGDASFGGQLSEDSNPLPSPQRDSGYMGDSPTSSVSTPGFPRGGGGPHFLTPSRRAASVGSIPGIQAFSRQHRSPLPPPPSSPSVRSSADSTSNLSELFCLLQGLIQRSQDIPELSVTISRPKTRQDASTQHSSPLLPEGEVPALGDLLRYYEAQGKLYRCPHCQIVFEERGLYFLHKSLHGEHSPWQCSICHKVCADRNDFHLHFVNQPHQAAP